jgi:hypothetical protein
MINEDEFNLLKTINKSLQDEVNNLKKIIEKKDNEIGKLKNEINLLKNNNNNNLDKFIAEQFDLGEESYIIRNINTFTNTNTNFLNNFRNNNIIYNNNNRNYNNNNRINSNRNNYNRNNNNNNNNNNGISKYTKCDQKQCTICLELFKEGENIRRLECLHIYHINCIKNWLKNKDQCPVCKFKVK